MGPITYAIYLTHKERGVGFSAKQAFQAQLGQGHSPITAVRLGEHTSDRSELFITLDGDANEETLTAILQKSGRLPREGVWKIDGLELIIPQDHPSLVKERTALEKRYTGTISRLQLEKNELQERIIQSAVKSVNSPLEGLLLYFEKIHPTYSLSVMIEEQKDLRFVREVLAGEKTNTFLDYHNFQHAEEPLTEPQLEEILAFTPDDISDEQEKLYIQAQEAQQELDYLQKIERAEIEVPASLKGSIIQQIRAREPERVIARYDDFSQKTNVKSQQRAEIVQEQERYRTVAEQIELLQQASTEMPMIIYSLDSGLRLYLPVATRGVKSGFLEDLGREMKERFGEQVSPLDHKFIAYQLENNTPENMALLHSTIREVPFTLRAAGVNKITPYQIG